MIGFLIIIGILLMVAGGSLTWLAMNSPVQLQPFTWIFFLAGAVMFLVGLRGWLL